MSELKPGAEKSLAVVLDKNRLTIINFNTHIILHPDDERLLEQVRNSIRNYVPSSRLEKENKSNGQ